MAFEDVQLAPNDQWVVMWECKLRNEPHDGLANGWKWRVQYHECEVGARLVYESMLPGPNGDFGPIEYRKQTMAKVIKQHND